VNPHTGERVDEATEVSPTPDNVRTADSVDDVFDPNEAGGNELTDERKDPPVVEIEGQPDDPADATFEENRHPAVHESASE
jgi:hypothetical protein